DQASREVIDMEPLHGDDHEALGQIVESAQSGVAEPVVRTEQGYFGTGIISFDGIIGNQHVTTTASQRASHRGCEPIPTARRLEFGFGGFLWIESRAGKHAFIEPSLDQSTGVARKFVSEILGVAGTNDSRCRIATEEPGWEGNRGYGGLERTRRRIEDQPLSNTAHHHFLHVVADGIDVPIRDHVRTIEGPESLIGKRSEVVAVNRIDSLAIGVLHFVIPLALAE